MKLDLSDNKKFMYLAGLRILINAGGHYQRLAFNLGMTVTKPASVTASYHLYQKVMASELTISLTEANIRRLIRALQALSYMYSTDEDVSKIVIGSNEYLGPYIKELYAASRGKKALTKFYKSGAFSVM